MAIPVVIAKNGFGAPIKPLFDGPGPQMRIAENGMGIPIVLSDLGAPVQLEWHPSLLFLEGREGIWLGGFDWNEGHMYRDTTGLTPVTEWDQNIGLMTRRAGTTDAIMLNAADRAVTARWPRGGRRNLLTWTEDFAEWGISEAVITPNHSLSPEGSLTAALLVHDAGETNNARMAIPTSSSIVSGVVQKISIVAKSAGARYLKIHTNNAGGVFDGAAFFDLVEGVFVNAKGHALILSMDGFVTSLGDGWFVCGLECEYTSYSNLVGFMSSTTHPNNTYNRGTTGNGEDGILIWHPHLQDGGGPLLPYQRVTTANDVTEAGVPLVHHANTEGGKRLETTTAPSADTYGLACPDVLGNVTFDTITLDGSTKPNLYHPSVDRQADAILVQGDFTPEEKARVEAFWAWMKAA